MACSFFPDTLVHVQGHLARNASPLRLASWQQDIVRPLFGWKLEDGWRQYRALWLELPRKNAKSTISSGFGCYMLFVDDEPGAQIYCAAADKDQARIVFNDAKRMIQASPVFSKVCTIYKDAIEYKDRVWRVLSSEAFSKHGLNVHCMIVDEVHAHKDRELIDTLRTGTGSRTQPLEIYITTAGFSKTSICWELHDYSNRIIDGSLDDPHWLPVIYGAEKTDDPWHEQTWHKANPGLNETIFMSYLRKEAKRAQEVPAYENIFKRLHLNMWTEQSERWMPMDRWDACERDFDIEQLRGSKCYGGLDMSMVTDLTALALTFPLEDGEFVCLPFFWAPEEGVDIRAKRDKVPYRLWSEQGFLRLTPGSVVDYDIVEEDIKTLMQKFRIETIRFDRYNATPTVVHLAKERPDEDWLIPMNQGKGLSRPTKELMACVLPQKLLHAAHPLMHWNMANVVVKIDEMENIYPDKKKSTERIDGVVALIMSLDGAVLSQIDSRSVYENLQGVTMIGGEEEQNA